MAKFFGELGYGESTEKGATGVWEDVIVEKSYYGDILRNSRRLQNGQYVNDDITVDNSVSIVADAYANEHFHAIKYVVWAGVRWIVTNVTVQRPRLILELGGVYNGPTPTAPVTP
jgi:hypothetical protein